MAEILDPARTALVLIDLQHGITAMPLAPRSGEGVVANAKRLAERFRAAGAPVFLVHVGWAGDGADRPSQRVDKPFQLPPGGLPPGWMDFVEGLEQPGDIRIHKRQWGAFTGTPLDLHLRRLGIDTLVVAGIATNFGVESTMRHGWELGYHLILAEDATTSRSAGLHEFAIANVFPQIARIRSCAELDFG